jgi:putative ABC transport system permease protein
MKKFLFIALLMLGCTSCATLFCGSKDRITFDSDHKAPVTAIIDAITYVLIAFVAISLVVSSIMIGVITLISVQERTKEIGILRAIGASKRNVSSMFTAETVIIGFAAGLLGVVVTYILCIPINAIINHLTGIPNLDAILPIGAAVILVGISVLLTLIAGMIPSRSAAKKDPVVALRTE